MIIISSTLDLELESIKMTGVYIFQRFPFLCWYVSEKQRKGKGKNGKNIKKERIKTSPFRARADSLSLYRLFSSSSSSSFYYYYWDFYQYLFIGLQAETLSRTIWSSTQCWTQATTATSIRGTESLGSGRRIRTILNHKCTWCRNSTTSSTTLSSGHRS